MAQKYNKTLAIEHLKKGRRVFLTDSPDNALLIVWNVSASRARRAHLDSKVVCSRLETDSMSLPFEQPHPLFDVKVKVIEELTM